VKYVYKLFYSNQKKILHALSIRHKDTIIIYPLHSALYYYINKSVLPPPPHPNAWFAMKLWLHQPQMTLQLLSQGRNLNAFQKTKQIQELGVSHNTFSKRMKRKQFSPVFIVKKK